MPGIWTQVLTNETLTMTIQHGFSKLTIKPRSGTATFTGNQTLSGAASEAVDVPSGTPLTIEINPLTSNFVGCIIAATGITVDLVGAT